MENLNDVINTNQTNPQADNNIPVVDDEIDENFNINQFYDQNNIPHEDYHAPATDGVDPEELKRQLEQNNNRNNNQNDNDGPNNNQNNGNNGQAGDNNQENREVDRRQQENVVEDVEINQDDLRAEADEPVVRRRRANSIDKRQADALNKRRRDINYNYLRPNENDLEAVPDLGAEAEKVMNEKIRIQREKERLRREREKLALQKARFRAEVARLKEEKMKLAAAAEELKNKEKGKKKGTPKKPEDPRPAEQKGYKIGEIKDGVTSSQRKKVNGIKHLVMDMDKTFRSSDEYRAIKSSLKEFDEFMKSISGRTRLTPEEMEMYDKLSLKSYNATTTYLEKKVDQRTVDPDSEEAKTAVEVNGELVSPKNEHERVRITQAKEIKNSIDEMRKEMFTAQLDFKTKEMDKKCQDALETEEKIRGQLLTNKMSDEELKTAMTESVAKTLFYGNRMDQLKKTGGLELKVGETFTSAYKRLDKSLEPNPEDMAKNYKDPVFQQIVQAGVDSIKSGKAFTGENIKTLFNEAAMKQSEKKIEEKRQEENMRKPAEINKNPEVQQPGLHN